MSGSSLQHLRSHTTALRKREARLQTFAVYGALCFMALIVIATLPHRLF